MMIMAAQQPGREMVSFMPEYAGQQAAPVRPDVAQGQMMAMVPPGAGAAYRQSLVLQPQDAEESRHISNKKLDDMGVKTDGYPRELGVNPEKVDFEKPGMSPFQDFPLSSEGRLKNSGVNVDRWQPHTHTQTHTHTHTRTLVACMIVTKHPVCITCIGALVCFEATYSQKLTSMH
jgi:hypothetical protein